MHYEQPILTDLGSITQHTFWGNDNGPGHYGDGARLSDDEDED